MDLIPILMQTALHYSDTKYRMGIKNKSGNPSIYLDPNNVVFLTPKEVAMLLRVSQDWIYLLIKEGKLPYLLVGKRQKRIHIKDLQVLRPGFQMPPPVTPTEDTE